MMKLLNFLLISSLTGAVTSSSTNLLNINDHKNIETSVSTKTNLLSLQRQNLSMIITERNLGDIVIPSNASANAKTFAILNALWSYNQDLDLSQISLQLVTDQGAIVTAIAGSDVYYGNVPITYNFISGQKIPLDNVLLNLNLGEIKSNNSVPSENEVKTAIKRFNKAINTEHISVRYITQDRAMVFGDNILYTGNIGVEFYTVQGTELNTVLTNKNLNLVYFNKKLNDQDLLNAIKRENTNIVTDGIMILNLKNNTAIVMGDGITYIGQVQVTFKSVFQTPLSTDLTVTNLGTIKVKRADADANNYYAVLINELLERNLNLQITIIQVKDGSDSITAASTTAVIEGTTVDQNLKIQNIYTGSITLNFSFQIN